MYNIVLRTANSKNTLYTKAVAIDLGMNTFAAIADTDAHITIIDGKTMLNAYRQVDSNPALLGIQDMSLHFSVNQLVMKWKSQGIQAVYVGCCGGRYLKLCNKKENHIFYRYRVFEKFVSCIETQCKINDIHCETTGFDESYTSLASAISCDYVPALEETETGKFSGVRNNQNYTVGKLITINSDVNGVLNILHKAGFDIVISADSNLDRHIIIRNNIFEGVIS